MTQGRKHIDYRGRRFGLLTAIERVGTGSRQKSALWRCVCDCGSQVDVSAAHLVKTPDRDCGCRTRTTTDGVPDACARPEYPCWSGMWTRCTWPGHRNYGLYGGRGISVCERWRRFATFLDDMGPRPSSRHSLDRFPNRDGNYEPGNVRWATSAEQNNNRQNNVFLEYASARRTISEWAAVTGVPQRVIGRRVRRGWSHERALTTPYGGAS